MCLQSGMFYRVKRLRTDHCYRLDLQASPKTSSDAEAATADFSGTGHMFIESPTHRTRWWRTTVTTIRIRPAARPY